MLAAVKDEPFGWPPRERPSLTAARHGGGFDARSGRKNGFAEVEQKNASIGGGFCLFLFSRVRSRAVAR